MGKIIGTRETTLKPQFIDLTQYIRNLPNRYSKVFLDDQPGIGGQEIGSQNYLLEYGIGKNFNSCEEEIL